MFLAITCMCSHITQTWTRARTFSPLISFILKAQGGFKRNKNVQTKSIQIQAHQKGQNYHASDDARTKVKTPQLSHRLFCLTTLDLKYPPAAVFCCFFFLPRNGLSSACLLL